MGRREIGKTRTQSLRHAYALGVSDVSGRVLVVDDNKVIRQLIKVNLEAEGLEVVTAADGAECVEVAPRLQPDAITLDVVMPRLDGLRAAAELRGDVRTRHIPIALVSGCTELERQAGREVGVDAFVAKPFEPAELVRVVCGLVGQSRARRRAAEATAVADAAPPSPVVRNPGAGPGAAGPAGPFGGGGPLGDDPVARPSPR